MSTHAICALDDLANPEARRFDIGGHAVCVVRIDNAVYAIGDTCSHADVSLSEGDVLPETCEIECWKHGSAFNLTTGEPQTLPATQPVPTFDAVVVNGMVQITITTEVHQ